MLGLRGQEKLVAGYGLREIATGVGILASANPRPWIWGRVAGDALDLASLSDGLRHDNPRRGSAGFALLAVAGVTVLDVIAVKALGARQQREELRRFDYSSRSGMPRPASAMRGVARDAQVPRDMRAPEAMRPYAG